MASLLVARRAQTLSRHIPLRLLRSATTTPPPPPPPPKPPTPPPPTTAAHAAPQDPLPHTTANSSSTTSTTSTSTASASARSAAGGDAHASPDETRTALHAAVLRAVPQHGWTGAAVSAALTDLGWSPAAAALLPRGIGSVLHALETSYDRQLAEHLRDLRREGGADGGGAAPQQPSPPHPHPHPHQHQGRDAARAAVADSLAYAINMRLRMQDEWHATWRSALVLRARTHAAEALRARLLLVDELAHHAGLAAPDLSWYADRAVLAAVYQAAELRWTADASRGRVDTLRFVERRVADAVGLRSRLGDGLAAVASLSDAAFATAATVVRGARGSY